MSALTPAEQYRQFTSSPAMLSAKYFFDYLLTGGDEKLGDFISDIKTGKTPSKSISKYYDYPDVSWFKPADIGGDIYLNKANSRVSNIAILEKKATLFKENTILITCIGDIGRVGILREDSSSNQQITGILTNDRLLPEFTYLYLASHRENFTDSGVLKTTLEIINQKKLRSLPIKVPSIEIQKAVIKFYFYYIENGFPDKFPDELKFCENQLIDFARLVDSSKVFSKNIKNELTYQQTLLKKLRQQILQDAIEGKLTKDWREQNPDVEPASELLKRIEAEKQQLIKDKKIKKQKPLPVITDAEKPFELPDSWRWCRLDDIGEAKTGLTYKPSDKSTDGTIVLRSSNIQKGKIDLNDLVRVSVDVNENKITDVGDILICARNGSRHLVGKSAVIMEYGMSFGAFMSIFRSDFYQYIYTFLQSNIFRNQFNDVKSTGISQLTQGVLRNIVIPFPPLVEHIEIVKKVEKLFAICDQLEAQIISSQTNAEQLMQSVLKEAFSQDTAA